MRTKGGNWYLMRINPYRTAENVIDGVVITFSDITEFKRATESLTERTEYAESIVRTVREPLILLNGELRIVSANPSFYRVFHVMPKNTEGVILYDLGDGQWNIPKLRELLEKILPHNAEIEGFMVEHEFPGIGKRRMLLNARKIAHADPKKELILLAIEDVTVHGDLPKTAGKT
ncbi:PAS fold protein [uncultured archaeon]|nr:PAS fold protein [uncultured archaeon]